MANRRAKIAELDAWLAGVHQHIDEQTELRQTDGTNRSTVFAVNDALGTPTTSPTGTGTDDDSAPPPPESSYGVDALKKQQEHDEDRADRRRRQSYRDKLAEAREAQRQQELQRKKAIAERSEIEKTYRGIGSLAQQAFQMGRGVFNRSRSRLEGIPTPGDIWVPLALLLFFFLVLFPVNGHTRLMWLWMTITRNAQIGGALPQPTLTPVTPQQNANVSQQLAGFVSTQPGWIPPPGYHANGPGLAGPQGSGPPFHSQLNGYTEYGTLLQGLE